MQELIIHQDTEKNKMIAVVENGKLVEKYEEKANGQRLEGNIYLGKVENVLVGMQAAFVDIGVEKNTFIHIKDIIPKVSNETGNKNELLSKHDIKNYIRPNMPILIQVKRDSTNKKGARVSTHISLPGRFVVLLPNSEFVTISKKIEKQAEKERLVHIVKANLPQGFGIIVRTSAQGKEEKQIKQDIQNMVAKWKDIQTKAEKIANDKAFCPTLIAESEEMLGRLLIDLADNELSRVITNDQKSYQTVQQFLKETELTETIKLELKQNEPILSMYDLEEQIDKANYRKIWLKCGGFITIDKTEALTAIDVNSGKYIGGKYLEQTVLTVNKEATIEIAKQLRLRDIGGIIIVDYIDMEKQETKQKILEVLEENLKKDRSKTQIIGFTPLDLLEITRKHMCSND